MDIISISKRKLILLLVATSVMSIAGVVLVKPFVNSKAETTVTTSGNSEGEQEESNDVEVSGTSETLNCESGDCCNDSGSVCISANENTSDPNSTPTPQPTSTPVQDSENTSDSDVLSCRTVCTEVCE